MPQLIEDSDYDKIPPAAAERIRRSERRDKLTSVLSEIASEVKTALCVAGLAIPVFLTVPRSDDAILLFATLLIPTTPDWDRACEIVCRVVENKSEIENLIARDLCCIATEPMGAADICINAAGSAELES
jgi:hypothetical protein